MNKYDNISFYELLIMITAKLCHLRTKIGLKSGENTLRLLYPKKRIYLGTSGNVNCYYCFNVERLTPVCKTFLPLRS